MFIEAGTFRDILKRERKERPPKTYDLGSIYALGGVMAKLSKVFSGLIHNKYTYYHNFPGDNRVEGRELVRDKWLGREVRMQLTANQPHIKRVAHPFAAAANERDTSKTDPRWTVQPRFEGLTLLCS